MTRSKITRRTPGICALALLASTVGHVAGCGASGAMAYFMGVGRGTKIKPQFTLPEGKILVLVDDPGEKVHWPRARGLLGQYVGEELLTHKAASAMISPESVAKFRQMNPSFEKYSAQAIGRKLGADAILWLEVRDFFAPTEIQDTSVAARMTISLKVLNVHEEQDRGKVRLWPVDRDGYVVESELKAVEVNRLKGKNAASKELARKAALYIGRLFYQHTLGDIDDAGE